MNDVTLRSRLPGVDVLALLGIAAGYGLWMKHWLGFVILPLALLLPFVLRELDVVRDDERVREAWRRAGFWAFSMFVAQGFILFAVGSAMVPDGRFLTSVGVPLEYVVVFRGPVIVFAAVYLMTVQGSSEGARKILLVLALLAAVGWASDRMSIGIHAGWNWAVSGGWWVRLIPALGLLWLSRLASRSPRLTGGLLLLFVAIGASFFYLAMVPGVNPQVTEPGLAIPMTLDLRFTVMSRLSCDLSLVILSLLLLRTRREVDA